MGRGSGEGRQRGLAQTLSPTPGIRLVTCRFLRALMPLSNGMTCDEK